MDGGKYMHKGGKRSAYNNFVSHLMKQGYNMKQCAEMWRNEKQDPKNNNTREIIDKYTDTKDIEEEEVEPPQISDGNLSKKYNTVKKIVLNYRGFDKDVNEVKFIITNIESIFGKQGRNLNKYSQDPDVRQKFTDDQIDKLNRSIVIFKSKYDEAKKTIIEKYEIIKNKM